LYPHDGVVGAGTVVRNKSRFLGAFGRMHLDAMIAPKAPKMLSTDVKRKLAYSQTAGPDIGEQG
jgi:hypothetical protein